MRRRVCSVAVLAFLLPILGIASQSEAAEHEYVGSSKCRKCHMREYKSWAESSMAKSFEVLKPGERAEQKTAAGLDPEKDYTKDAECVACHSTGYGKPGGFVDIATTPDLAGVGCESCHGPGGTYLKDGYMTLQNKEYKKADLVAVGLVGEITVGQCQGCHNTKSPFVGDDYVFDFEANKDKGAHEKFPLKYKH